MKAALATPTKKKRMYGGVASCFRNSFHYKEYEGEVPEYSEEEGVKCDKCGLSFIHHGSNAIVYDTPSGELEPGCLYWDDHLPENYYWDDHKGPHLCAVTPNGHHWVIDGRASNCKMKEDRKHRCWVRHGEPPNITVDKAGVTCKAGAGSIITAQGKHDEYHGHLCNGIFTPWKRNNKK